MARETSNRPMGVRMPDELRKRLKEKATKNHRTLGSEIVFRLEESLNREEAAQTQEKTNV